MSLRTPLVIAVAVLSALGGVALAAIAMPSAKPRTVAAVAGPSATPEVQTKTIRRTVHVVRRDKSSASSSSSSRRPARAAATPVATPAPTRSVVRVDDSGHHDGTRRVDDSGHHGGTDDSGHHGGDDHGGRGRGRGGDDD